MLEDTLGVLALLALLFGPSMMFSCVAAFRLSASRRTRPLGLRVIIAAVVGPGISLALILIFRGVTGPEQALSWQFLTAMIAAQIGLVGLPVGLVSSKIFDRWFDRQIT